MKTRALALLLASAVLTIALSTCSFYFETGPAGGFIFYDKGIFHSSDWRYLEAAPNDITASGWGTIVATGATGKNVGTGETNTAKMIATYGSMGNAAWPCSDYELNGYSDWFLPSFEELKAMYNNLKKNGRGNFTDAEYWSSTEVDAIGAYFFNFQDGTEGQAWKSDYFFKIRPIRAFK